MNEFEAQLRAALAERQAQGRYRQRRMAESPQGATVTVDGRVYTSFASNDYLGLASHPDLINAFQKAASTWGVGSGASHLIYGHTRAHHELEDALAEFTGRDRALLFSTGFMANTGTLSALLGEGDWVLQDKLNHASLLDGGLASGARFQRYLHNDLQNLEMRLQRAAAANARRILIVTDGVFSMDGDIAPLAEISQLAARYNAVLMVDDAHGIGVLGDHGGGCAEQFALDQNALPILMGTLGKAFGGFGAFVAGSHALIENLIQFARPYIYTTALPPAVAAANLAALNIIKHEHWRREHLQTLIQQFRAGAQQLGLTLMPSPTPIQPVVLGDEATVMRVSAQLAEKGFLVGAIRPPTVVQGSCRLRITLSAAHTSQQVDDLLGALSVCLVASEKAQ